MTFRAPSKRSVDLVLLFLVGLVVGCGRPKPPEEPPAAPVKAEQAKKLKYAQWTELLGTTQPLPNQSAKVSAAVEGKVLWVLGDGKSPPAVEGQWVAKNQILVKLDDRVARANRDKAAATAEEMKEQENQAGFAVEKAEIDVDRLEKLQPMVPIELAQARIALKDAKSKKQGAVAKLKANKAEVKALDDLLELYEIQAPLSGRLGMIQVVPGQTLVVGTVIADVVYLDEVDVLCYVSPRTMGRLAEGQPARIKDDDSEAEGEIVYIAPSAQPDTGNVAVKARIENKGLRHRANMVLRIEVQTERVAERLAISEEAILEDQDPPAVIVVDKVKTEKKEDKVEITGEARKLRAKLGVRDPETKTVEILELKDDKDNPVDFHELLFITEGAHGLADGDPVKVMEEEHEEEK